jgi:hypothetical protein
MLFFFPCFEFGIISCSEMVDKDPCNGIVKELKMIIVHVWKPKSYGWGIYFLFCFLHSFNYILWNRNRRNCNFLP